MATASTQRALGGDQRILDGGGHAPQTAGPRFNALLEAFMRATAY